MLSTGQPEVLELPAAQSWGHDTTDPSAALFSLTRNSHHHHFDYSASMAIMPSHIRLLKRERHWWVCTSVDSEALKNGPPPCPIQESGPLDLQSSAPASHKPSKVWALDLQSSAPASQKLTKFQALDLQSSASATNCQRSVPWERQPSKTCLEHMGHQDYRQPEKYQNSKTG